MTAYATYEERLASSLTLALREGSMHFEARSAVQKTLRSVTVRLDTLGLDYVVVGGMALFSHGLRRFTEDVDILVTREGLKLAHEQLEGSGYRPPFPHSKNLRDTDTGVRIEFLVTGEYPGDGKPKPVAFPEPQTVAEEREGIKFARLSALIELKLASGMTNPDRLKDLADVLELIRLFHLPEDYAARLNPYVGDKYHELWHSIHANTRRFITIRQTLPLPESLQSLDDLLAALPADASKWTAMRDAGIVLDTEKSRLLDGYLVLATTNPSVAERFGLHDETEMME
jgi:hypothetical protein